jgi:hypothetical protein
MNQPNSPNYGLRVSSTAKMMCLAELGVDTLLPDLPAFEQAVWDLDFRLNTRGMPIDITGVERAIQFSAYYTEKNTTRFNEDDRRAPDSAARYFDYIEQREEIENLGNLRSKTLKRIVQSDLPQDLQDVINIRLETSKASIKKLETMMRCTDSDGRARGPPVLRRAYRALVAQAYPDRQHDAPRHALTQGHV